MNACLKRVSLMTDISVHVPMLSKKGECLRVCGVVRPDVGIEQVARRLATH